MRALVTRIIRDGAGNEYRLEAGRDAPSMPEQLLETLEAAGYIEPRPKPAPKPAWSRRKKDRKEDDD